MNTNIEVNKQIHTILGKCWHDSQQISNLVDDWTKCSKCGYFQGPNPDYTNDLNAVAEAERWVIEKVGYAAYGRAISQIPSINEKECLALLDGADKTNLEQMREVVGRSSNIRTAETATATALQRATACLKALGVKG